MIHLERHSQRLIERNSRITIINLRQKFRRLRRSQIPLLLNHIVRGRSPQRKFLLLSLEQFLLQRRLLSRRHRTELEPVDAQSHYSRHPPPPG